jgi:hypothetical protein
MTKRNYSSSIGIACCLLFLAAGSANAEIIRCTDDTGSTTFTDTPCTADSRTIQALPVIAVPTADKVFAQQEKFAAAEKTRSVAAINTVAISKNYSLDERTVRGAKVLTDSMDIASELARQQASAERALRTNRWAFWRS